ncbi:MAG: copper resistance protein CopC [Gemmatimonadetes bacterium]|jgi:methionine-rich copper-binding protein CopC|nr:copper resistance protein CopC [Gemmatimonadota bacterium]
MKRKTTLLALLLFLTVAWRAIGDDGHVVRGDFTFSVAVQ